MSRIAVLVVSLLAASMSACHSATGPGSMQSLLANVVDPESVNAVSTFHSCVGHAYPEPNSPNSGKNYFWPNSTNFSTTNLLREYAACDGTTGQTSADLSADQQDRGQTIHLHCDNSSTALRYFHLNFDPGLVGRHVRAGDFLGYASMLGTGQSPSAIWQYSSAFDVAVSDGDDRNTEDYFATLSASAFAAWAPRGLTSVSQTLTPGNPTCSGYSADIGNPDIFLLTPVR